MTNFLQIPSVNQPSNPTALKMKTVAIFVVMFAAAVAMKLEESPPERRPSEQSTGRCVEYGIDYTGYDIDIIYNIYHWSDCAQKCNDHRSCSYWTWVQNDEKRCILKSSNAGRRKLDAMISGSYDCLSEC